MSFHGSKTKEGGKTSLWHKKASRGQGKILAPVFHPVRKGGGKKTNRKRRIIGNRQIYAKKGEKSCKKPATKNKHQLQLTKGNGH